MKRMLLIAIMAAFSLRAVSQDDTAGNGSVSGVVAWDRIPSGAFQNAQFVAQYEERGSPITVESNSHASVTLSVIAAKP